MAYPTELVAGAQFTAAQANDYTLNPVVTAGETITATGAPKAVYMKASDSKVYKASAATQAHVDGFIGFVVLDSVANDSRRVMAPGKVISGLSGLTVGAAVYLSDTAGAVSTTPGTISLQVGIAQSTTTMLIIRPPSVLSGISSNVTAANLNTLTAGSSSDADALHKHTAGEFFLPFLTAPETGQNWVGFLTTDTTVTSSFLSFMYPTGATISSIKVVMGAGSYSSGSNVVLAATFYSQADGGSPFSNSVDGGTNTTFSYGTSASVLKMWTVPATEYNALTAGQPVSVKVSRIGNDASDNLDSASTFRLLGVLITFG